MKKIVPELVLLLLLSACSGGVTIVLPTSTEVPEPAPTGTSEPTPTEPDPTPTALNVPEVDRFAFEQNARLGQGVNLGNALEAPNEGEWGVTLEESYFDLIREAGFDSVRVPIRWNAHAAEDAPYKIDPVFFDRVDWVVNQATKRDLAVIVNIHHYEEIMKAPKDHKDRFLAIWEQIANHFKDAPDSVFFELMNEPNGYFAATDWNQYAIEAINLIQSSNPRRTIILGPGNWNSISNLYELKLPSEERNLIVTVHYYQPFQFTHQGAEWVIGSDPWLGTQWTGSADEMAAILRDFDTALSWSDTNSRPIFLGEFGAYSKADSDSRHRWTEFIARSAEERGFSWAYWEFCSGFGVYDPSLKTWNELILSALLPGEK